MRVNKPPKSTLGRMMEEEELMSKAAGCPPGHTWNPNVKKCIPGSPLSGLGGVYTEMPGLGGGNKGEGATKPAKDASNAVKIAKEVQSRKAAPKSA